MKTVDKGICAPAGFRAGAAAAGIKKAGTARLDCALIVSDRPASVAGVFTTNIVQAAPVRYCRDLCRHGKGRAIFANSGNANACTGTPGDDAVLKTARILGALLQVPQDEVCVCSTGVIGVPMPMDRLEQGARACVAALSDKGGPDAARAIMTTDTKPKEVAIEVPLSSGRICLGGIAKGAGMIAPNMATMLCFLATDAAVAAVDLRHLLFSAAEQSFNCICVDNDMSTNDTLLCLANGASGTGALAPGSADYQRFGDALNELCRELAQSLVRDGEGATKFVEIEVTGAPDRGSAKRIAASVARSQLCKTAFYGKDANWGRIACAAGYAGVVFEPCLMDIYIQGIRVLAQGCPVPYEEAEIQARMQSPDLRVRLELNSGGERAAFWTSDLSVEYVNINADYRT